MDEKCFIPYNTKLGQKESSSAIINGPLQASTRKARDLAASNGINAALLCLECRQTGHIVNKCPFPWPSEKPGRFFSPGREGLGLRDPFERTSRTVVRKLSRSGANTTLTSIDYYPKLRIVAIV